jgi:hypothetical protein
MKKKKKSKLKIMRVKTLPQKKKTHEISRWVVVLPIEKAKRQMPNRRKQSTGLFVLFFARKA